MDSSRQQFKNLDGELAHEERLKYFNAALAVKIEEIKERIS